MNLLSSLICWQGCDNRARFISIHTLSYILFIIASVVFSTIHTLAFITLILVLSVNLYSTKRRLNDAKLALNWILIPSAILLLAGTTIIFTLSPTWYWLLLAPFIFSTILMTYPTKENKQYILGYSGPIDLSQWDTNNLNHNTSKSRIEPSLYQTINTESTTSLQENTFSHIDINDEYQNSNINSSIKKQDIGELIRLKVLSHKNALFTLIAVSTLIIVAMIISTIVLSKSNIPPESSITPTNNVQIQSPTNQINELSNSLIFPDGFTLSTTPFKGLAIHWEGSNSKQGELWSQSSAIGDDSCTAILFNNKDTIRTLSVIYTKDKGYYSYFSPLDTEKLIKMLAYKNTFSLCGMEFSLKGSQKAIGKKEVYAEYLSI